MLRRKPRTDTGAAAVEFALVMPILLVLVFGIIQYGLYFWGMQAGTSATSDAVRRLTVGDCQTTSSLQNFLQARLGSANTGSASSIATTLVYKKANGASDVAPGTVGGSVQLTVTYQSINLNFPFIPVPDSGKVTRTVFGRVEDTVPTAGGCA